METLSPMDKEPTTRRALFFTCILLFVAATARSQTLQAVPSSAPASRPAKTYNMKRFAKDGWAKMPPEWFGSEEAAEFAENVLSWQLPVGGWPKRLQIHLRQKDPNAAPSTRGSFDNDATVPQMRFIGHMVEATRQPRYKEAFLKGLDFILAAQMPCGGWPQTYPTPRGYHGLITYNDGAMINVMTFLRSVAAGQYDFVGQEYRDKARAAVDRGVDCILKTQVVLHGQLTVWGQQHDPNTFAPAQARTFELPCLTPDESRDIVDFLMEIENPSPEVKRAIHSAIAWMKRSALSGIRAERRGGDLVVVQDPNAGPLWARCYDLDTGRPFFADRDGEPKDSLAEIDQERRTGYDWYGDWPLRAFAHYEKWCAQHSEKPVE